MGKLTHHAIHSRAGHLDSTLLEGSEELSRLEAEHQLQDMVDKSRDILLSVSTVFPFTLFPDTITIDREKISIAHRLFFKVSEVMSVRIEDILNITANVGPFFGSVKISTRFFYSDKPYEVNYFRRNDALRIKRIMQGYIIATQKKLNCNTLDKNALATMLEELGSG